MNIVAVIAYAAIIIASATIIGTILHRNGVSIEHATTEPR